MISDTGLQKSILGGKIEDHGLESTFTPGPGQYFEDGKGLNQHKIPGFRIIKKAKKKNRSSSNDAGVSPVTYSPTNPCHTSRGAVIGTSTRNAGVKDTSTSPGPNAYYVKGDFDKPRKEKILSYSNFSGDRDLGESPGPG